MLVPASVFPKEKVPDEGGWFAAVIGPSATPGCTYVQFGGDPEMYFFPDGEICKWVISETDSSLALKAARALKDMRLKEVPSPPKRRTPKRATPASKARRRSGSGDGRDLHGAAEAIYAAATARAEAKPAASSAAAAGREAGPSRTTEEPASPLKRGSAALHKRKSEAVEPAAGAGLPAAAPAHAQGTAPLPEQQAEEAEVPGRAAQRPRVEEEHGGWGERRRAETSGCAFLLFNECCAPGGGSLCSKRGALVRTQVKRL